MNFLQKVSVKICFQNCVSSLTLFKQAFFLDFCIETNEYKKGELSILEVCVLEQRLRKAWKSELTEKLKRTKLRKSFSQNA